MKVDLRLKDKIFLLIVGVIILLTLTQKIVFLVGGSKETIEEEKTTNQLSMVKIGEKAVLQVFVAETPKEQFQGLSGVAKIDENKGMLFAHKNKGRQAYVMRGMMIDLDFIFIRDNQVVDIAKNIAKEYWGEIIGGDDYNFVLEVNAGWSSRNNIQLGDKVEISGLSKNK